MKEEWSSGTYWNKWTKHSKISLTTLKAVIEYLYVLDAKAREIVCYGPLVHEEKVITKKKLSVEFRQICFSIGKEQKKIWKKTEMLLFGCHPDFIHSATP